MNVASTNAERIAAAAERLDAQGAALDVTDETAVAVFFAGSGGFDHVVTTAGDFGGPRRVPLVDLDLTAAASLFRVRFWGAVALAKHGAAARSHSGTA